MTRIYPQMLHKVCLRIEVISQVENKDTGLSEEVPNTCELVLAMFTDIDEARDMLYKLKPADRIYKLEIDNLLDLNKASVYAYIPRLPGKKSYSYLIKSQISKDYCLFAEGQKDWLS